MPGCSCAPNCKSNYDGGQSVRVHKFPSDRATREAWTRAVPRKDFSPTKYTVIDRASRWPVERAVEALDILSLTFPLDAREESRKLGATLPTLLQRENPLPQRTIPVLGAQARGRLFLRCPLDATSRGVKMSMEVRHGEELLVTIKDMEEVRALTRTSTAVGHAAQTTWTVTGRAAVWHIRRRNTELPHQMCPESSESAMLGVQRFLLKMGHKLDIRPLLKRVTSY
ncbi:uncharacterized protein LOC142575560 isoform X3 [Dermacentor variabilis]|uniref:uncharacterized protein LOC142575560 isoform X3 n=1 Tax=Dermacentor variabilis TaxID=34621 RepID=UPI003F5B43C9